MSLDVAVMISPGQAGDAAVLSPDLVGATEAKLRAAIQAADGRVFVKGTVDACGRTLDLGFVGCPVIAEDLTGPKALAKAQAVLAGSVRSAAAKGVRHIALAGANAVFGESPAYKPVLRMMAEQWSSKAAAGLLASRKRVRLAEVLSRELDVYLTTGYRLGTWAICEQLSLLADRLGVDLANERVGIVGGGGRFAHKLVSVLSRWEVRNLLLQDIQKRGLQTVSHTARRDSYVAVETTTDYQLVLEEAAIVVFVPSVRRPIVETWGIPRGSIHLCDTYPRVHRQDVVERQDVVATQVTLRWPKLALEVEAWQLPYLYFSGGQEIWPCGMEAGIAAALGLQQSLLDPGEDPARVRNAVREVGQWAGQLGVEVAPFQAFGCVIPPRQLDHVSRLRQETRRTRASAMWQPEPVIEGLVL